MFTKLDKALVAGILPFVFMFINYLLGTSFIADEATVAAIWGVIQGVVVYFVPNKGTVYTGDAKVVV